MFEFVNNFNHSLIKRRITMMTKGKSKSWAKSKFLLLVPVICVLVLAFANPRAAASTDHTFAPAVTTGQDSADDAKKKEKQQKLTALIQKEKELKELYAKTDDPEKKKMIGNKLEEILKAKKNGGWAENGPTILSEKEYANKTEKIKALLETTEDPKKRKQLKSELNKLQELKTNGFVKPDNIDYEKEALILREMLEKEKDPEKKKIIKEKLAKLKVLAAKEKSNKKVK